MKRARIPEEGVVATTRDDAAAPVGQQAVNPDGKGAKTEAAPRFVSYTVKPGDTLARIAQRVRPGRGQAACRAERPAPGEPGEARRRAPRPRRRPPGGEPPEVPHPGLPRDDGRAPRRLPRRPDQDSGARRRARDAAGAPRGPARRGDRQALGRARRRQALPLGEARLERRQLGQRPAAALLREVLEGALDRERARPVAAATMPRAGTPTSGTGTSSRTRSARTGGPSAGARATGRTARRRPPRDTAWKKPRPTKQKAAKRLGYAEKVWNSEVSVFSGKRIALG